MYSVPGGISVFSIGGLLESSSRFLSLSMAIRNGSSRMTTGQLAHPAKCGLNCEFGEDCGRFGSNCELAHVGFEQPVTNASFSYRSLLET